MLQGMGLIVLHSGHFSKIFKKLMGTSCDLKWREADEKERIWVVNPGAAPVNRESPRYGNAKPLETIKGNTNNA